MRLIILVLVLTGCAAAQPSSTDRHDRIPTVTCAMVIVSGNFRRVCCDNTGRCYFAD